MKTPQLTAQELLDRDQAYYRAKGSKQASAGMTPLNPLLYGPNPVKRRNADLQSLLNMRNADEKTVAERKWTAPLKPKAEQKACDAGLFSDDSKQTELF